MPYIVPTYDQFVARFPIFADKDQTLIEMLLVEAANTIDQTWRELDYQPAILYLGAHLLATDNSGEGESVELGDPGNSGIVSESFGGMSVNYGKSSSISEAAKSKWGNTEYGRRFFMLLKANKPAIVSV